MLFLKDWGGDYTSIFLLIAFFLLLLYRYKRGAAADGWKFGRLPTKSWKMSRFFLSNAIVLTGCLSFLGIAFSVSEMRPKKLGADIVFVLDNTYSMQAPVKTVGGRQLTRMDVMVEVVNDIFGMLGSQKSKNRITLISFGWDAWKLNNYPTDDYRLLAGELSRRVNRWSSMLYGREGSNLGAALIEGVIAFPEKNPTQEERKKIMIVISDGEPYGKREIIQKQIGSALTSYARLAEISLFVIGIGSPDEEVPIPMYDFFGNNVGWELDKNGLPVKTRSDFAFLKDIASQAGGIFVQYGDSLEGLKKQVKSGISSSQETDEKEEIVENRDLSYYFLCLYFVLLSLFFLRFRN